jgi:hypothetical protein
MKYNKNLITQELNKLNNVNYYGSDEQIVNENYIVNHSNVEMLYNESIQEYYHKLNTMFNR